MSRKMGRSPFCAKEGLKRGAWTSLEDKILIDYIKSHGEGKWRSLPQRAGLNRCGKSCRLRWLNYLRPDIKRGNITEEEEDLIIRLHNLLGNRWSLIAGRLPGRTDNEIKNYWNTKIGKSNNQSGQSVLISNKKYPKKPASCSSTASKSRLQEIPYSENMRRSSCLVRTKATRCSKVSIDPHLQSSQPPGIMAMADLPSSSSSRDNGRQFNSVSLSGGVPETLFSPTFWGDFDMNDKFFSDFFEEIPPTNVYQDCTNENKEASSS